MSNLETDNLPVLSSDSPGGFSRYLHRINSIPSLTQEEEFLFAKNYLEQNDLAAAHRLVVSHLKLVAKIALQYRNYGLPLTELVSEGNLGLMQAVKKYDPHLGHRLSTYAMWWIKAAIQEYILRSWSLVKMGTTAAQKKLFFSLGRIKRKLSHQYGRAIHDGDYDIIAQELGVTKKEVSEMTQRLSGPDLSLNNPIGSEDESDEMIDLIPETKPNCEIALINRETLYNQKQVLFDALKELGEREARILKSRKLSHTPSTLDSLSNEYNISKERVRQIENRAFEKVQNYVLSHISDDGQLKTV